MFAPTQSALEAMPAEVMEDLRADKERLREFLLYHVATPRTCKCEFEDGKTLESAAEGGKKLRINVYSSAPVNLFDLRPKQVKRVLKILKDSSKKHPFPSSSSPRSSVQS